ncbi:MAG: hypothetical protein Q7V40_03475 [Pseudolabrys sp.]|nr:hypothetical protein [Pseudolabrys sp.]
MRRDGFTSNRRYLLTGSHIVIDKALGLFHQGTVLRNAKRLDQCIDVLMRGFLPRFQLTKRPLHVGVGLGKTDIAYADLHTAFGRFGGLKIVRDVLLRDGRIVRGTNRGVAHHLCRYHRRHEQDAQARHDRQFDSDADVRETKHLISPGRNVLLVT